MHLKTIFFLLVFLIQFVPYTRASDSPEDKTTFSAHTKLFEAGLGKVKQSLQGQQTPTIFICYASGNETHQNRIKTLVHHFLLSGIKATDLYYNPQPGGGVNHHQHADRIFKANKIIVVGSRKLKERYEKKEGGRGSTTQIIDNLLTRINQQGPQGIIPLWFEGKFKENFPLTFKKLPHQKMNTDYFLEFFDLLNNLYQLNAHESFILQYKEDFVRQRGSIPNDILELYGKKLLQYQQDRVRKDQQKIEEILLNQSDKASAHPTVKPKRKKEKGQEKPEEGAIAAVPLNEEEDLWKSVTSEIPLSNLPDSPKKFIESAPKDSKVSYLTMVWKALHKNQNYTVAHMTPVIQASITGMGGLGKSTLAKFYTHKAFQRKCYDFIYWLKSENDEDLLKGYQGILKKLKHMLQGTESLEELIEAVKEGLLQKKKWLLVYDNVPDSTFLANKTPQYNGHILITSRYNEGWDTPPITLDVFREEDALNYIFDAQFPHKRTEDNLEIARLIISELGSLPLALSHAKAFMDYRKTSSMEEYYQKLKDQPEVTTISSAPFNKDPKITHEHLIRKTWEMAGEIISPLAKKLMIYFSYMDPDQLIMESFISNDKTKDNLDDSFAQLQAFSLIKKNQKIFSIHRLVQLVIRNEQETKSEELQELPAQKNIKEVVDLFLSKTKQWFAENYEDINRREEMVQRLPSLFMVLEHAKRLGLEREDHIEKFEWIVKILCVLGIDIWNSLSQGIRLEGVNDRLEMINKKFISILKNRKSLLSSNDVKVSESTFEWFENITSQRSVRINNIVGDLLRDGVWIKQDYKKALEWYQQAANQKNTTAQFKLGLMYEEGKGAPQDYKKALEWYQQAAKQGNTNAQFKIGLMYEKGQGVLPQDNEKALEWYQQAAKQGNATAQFKLGLMYEKGQGVSQDNEKALRWFQKSHENHHSKAWDKVQTLARKLLENHIPTNLVSYENIKDLPLSILNNFIEKNPTTLFDIDKLNLYAQQIYPLLSKKIPNEFFVKYDAKYFRDRFLWYYAEYGSGHRGDYYVGPIAGSTLKYNILDRFPFPFSFLENDSSTTSLICALIFSGPLGKDNEKITEFTYCPPRSKLPTLLFDQHSAKYLGEILLKYYKYIRKINIQYCTCTNEGVATFRQFISFMKKINSFEIAEKGDLVKIKDYDYLIPNNKIETKYLESLANYGCEPK